MNGWIKIHRTMLEWEHFNEPSVVTVFLALLLNADKDGKTGITIGAIANLTGLHPNTVKRAIAKLVSSGEVTREKYGSRITTAITNWSEYQSVQKLDRYRDNNSTDIGTKKVPIQYNKNNKNNKEVVADTRTRTHEDFIADALNDLRVEQGCMAMRITAEEYRQLVTEVTNDWIFRNIPGNEWTLTHLLAQMRIKHNINNRNHRNNGNQRTNNNGNAADTSPDAFARYFAAKELERRAAQGTGHVS